MRKYMEIYLSKSSIETYVQCGAKFGNRYISKIEFDENDRDKESATFGQVIHSVQEEYHKNNKQDNILDLYHKHFNEYKILSQNLFELGNRMVTDYVLDSDNGNKVLGLEYEFKLFLDNGVPVKGVIDRIDEISEDEVEIIDYKTGYSRPLTPAQLKTDIQLGIYNLVIKQLMPKYKRVKLTLDYLHFGKISIYRTDKELQDQSDYLAMIHQKICESIATSKGLEPNVNSYCSFCQYRSTCKAFTAIANTKFKPEDDAKRLQGLISKESGVVVPIEKLDQFLETVKAKIKILEKVEKDAKSFIIEQVAKNGKDGSVKIGKTTYSVASKKYTTYDVPTVLEVMTQYEPSVDINTVLAPQKTVLDTLFKANPEAIDKLKKTSKPSYSESYLK